MVFYISQLVRFARIYNNVSDFSDSNLVKTEKNHLHTVLMNYWRHLQNFITVIKVLFRDTILHAEIWPKKGFQIYVFIVT